jgi:uncharacterized protein YndB with AHSA1/START domain
MKTGLCVSLALAALPIGARSGEGAAVAQPPPAAAEGWRVLSRAGGIVVMSREIPGSPILAFRGEAVLEAPIARVAAVLADTARKHEWVARLKEARLVREASETDRVEYNRTAVPRPAKDRDFVFRAEAEIDEPGRRIVIRMRSVEDPAVPPGAGLVRGEIVESVMILGALPGGGRTHVILEIHADPKGAVPKWLVNLFQRTWPRVTLEGLRRQVAKPDAGEHPGVKALWPGEG